MGTLVLSVVALSKYSQFRGLESSLGVWRKRNPNKRGPRLTARNACKPENPVRSCTPARYHSDEWRSDLNSLQSQRQQDFTQISINRKNTKAKFTIPLAQVSRPNSSFETILTSEPTPFLSPTSSSIHANNVIPRSLPFSLPPPSLRESIHVGQTLKSQNRKEPSNIFQGNFNSTVEISDTILPSEHSIAYSCRSNADRMSPSRWEDTFYSYVNPAWEGSSRIETLPSSNGGSVRSSSRQSNLRAHMRNGESELTKIASEFKGNRYNPSNQELPEKDPSHSPRSHVRQFPDHNTSPDNVILQDLAQIKHACNWKRDHTTYSGADHVPLRTVKPLGDGSSGVVEEVQAADSEGATFVRKSIYIKRDSFSKAQPRILKEIQAMRRMVHPHIIKLIGSYEVSPASSFMWHYCLLMYPVGQGDLQQLLLSMESSPRGSQEPTFARTTLLKKWFICLTSAVAYMHGAKPPLHHQDIKPKNIIYRDANVFITDFGSVRLLAPEDSSSTEVSRLQGTRMYAAPEIVHAQEDSGEWKRRGPQSDVFSLGCVFLEMLICLSGNSLSTFRAYCQSAHRQLVPLNDPRVAARPATTPLVYCDILARVNDFVDAQMAPQFKTFYVTVVKRMLALDRHRRPAAAELGAELWHYYQQVEFAFDCECWGDFR